MSVKAASPGPFTTHPIIDNVIGVFMWDNFCSNSFTVSITLKACLARQAFKVIDTVKELEQKLSHIKTPITLSIIGCVVNGPGEAALTDIGITGGGKGSNMLYLSGVQSEKVLTGDIIKKVISEVEKKAAEIEKK